MGVPEQSDVIGIGRLQHIFKVAEEVKWSWDSMITVTLCGPAYVAEFAQSSGDPSFALRHRARAFVRFCFAAKDTHIGRAQGCGQIDEAASVRQFLCPLRRDPPHTIERNCLHRRSATCWHGFLSWFAQWSIGAEDGKRGQIQISLQTAQFDGGESMLGGKVQNLLPLPLGHPSVENAIGQRGLRVSFQPGPSAEHGREEHLQKLTPVVHR